MFKILLILSFIMTVCSYGEVLIAPKTQEDFGETSKVKVSDEGIARGVDRLVACKEKFPIDPAALYRISGEFKKADGVQAAKVSGMIGTMQYDAKGRVIGGIQNAFLPGSEAKVLKAVSPGDKTMEIEINKAWCDVIMKSNKRRYAVFLFAKKDYSDMPSFSFCWIERQFIENGRIILTAANFPAVPAGSLVRLHANGWVCNGVEVKATDEWQQTSVDIRGVSAKASLRQWWKGAAQGTLAIYGKDVLFRNIKIEKIEE